MFFNVPTQVKFYDSEDKSYVGGIAYKDEVFCGCCGSVFEISDIIADAEELGVGANEAIIALPWIDIQLEIIGE